MLASAVDLRLRPPLLYGPYASSACRTALESPLSKQVAAPPSPAKAAPTTTGSLGSPLSPPRLTSAPTTARHTMPRSRASSTSRSSFHIPITPARPSAPQSTAASVASVLSASPSASSSSSSSSSAGSTSAAVARGLTAHAGLDTGLSTRARREGKGKGKGSAVDGVRSGEGEQRDREGEGTTSDEAGTSSEEELGEGLDGDEAEGALDGAAGSGEAPEVEPPTRRGGATAPSPGGSRARSDRANGADEEGEGSGGRRDEDEASEDGSEEMVDDEEEEEEDEEPTLKYARWGGGSLELFAKDTASAIAVCAKYTVRCSHALPTRSRSLRRPCTTAQVLGTHNGAVFVHTPEGQLVKRYRPHSAMVNALSVDSTCDFVASASMDGAPSFPSYLTHPAHGTSRQAES